MPIADYMPAAHERRLAEQGKAERAAEAKRKLKDSIVTHKFQDAASRYAPEIADALVSGEYFKVRLDGWAAVPAREIPRKVLTSLWATVASNRWPTVLTYDVERNGAYKAFQKDLEAQGIKISDMETLTETGMIWKHVARMRLKAETPAPAV